MGPACSRARQERVGLLVLSTVGVRGSEVGGVRAPVLSSRPAAHFRGHLWHFAFEAAPVRGILPIFLFLAEIIFEMGPQHKNSLVVYSFICSWIN